MFARGSGVFGVGWGALQHYERATGAEVTRTANLLLAVALVLRMALEDLCGALAAYIKDHWDELVPFDLDDKGREYHCKHNYRMTFYSSSQYSTNQFAGKDLAILCRAFKFSTSE